MYYSGTTKFTELFGAGDSSHVKDLEQLATRPTFDDPCSIQFTSVSITY